ncbi:sigma 54-interacting transcriptional regulator [Youngiibacter fragilis]|uniref:Fis family transcriptional regulator n=1 Tax=Youngiibacter fragilis 232.1 TaxID=994573 RepID=V4EH56_9CLOT|nr:sigma 54-interacting transcriptional regulator [Youngiibacter fragilis]ETA81562.1 Fis family transcriptional regulator [Youngiibacter fragilis 232.1]
MAKIAFMAPRFEMIELAEGIVKKMDAEVLMQLSKSENIVEMTKKAMDNGYDVVIARGTQASIIKDSGLGIPLVEIRITGQEIAMLMHEAKKLLNKERPKLAFIGFENMYTDIMIFGDIVGVEVKTYLVKSREDLLPAVDRAVRDKSDALIGGDIVNTYAKGLGVPCLFLESTEDSISQAFEIAEKIVMALDIEKKQSAEFKAVVDYSFDAIIKTDNNGIITIFNHNAEESFRTRDKNAIGKKITSIIPEIDQADLAKVKKGQEVFGTILTHDETVYIANFAPINVDGKLEGVIFSFSPVEKIEDMAAEIKREIYLKGHIAKYTFKDIHGISNKMRSLKDMALKYSKNNSTVLISGESGTGKELFAQSIHNESLRKNNPFVAVNCAALPSNLLESELFGYVEGAFTGASKGGKRGLFHLADTGTIFLDEISEMDLYGQVRLLRVIQEKNIMRVGDDKVTPIDVRIIAATNKNLMDLIRQGKFREDLYYRLNILSLHIPPLRERREDILVLTDFFTREYSVELSKSVTFSEGARKLMSEYDWYGNIRQLKNFVEKVVTISSERVISEELVRFHIEDSFPIDQSQKYGTIQSNGSPQAEEIRPYTEAGEYTRIIALLDKHSGNRMAVAKELGISTTTLWRKIRKYNISTTYGGEKI